MYYKLLYKGFCLFTNVLAVGRLGNVFRWLLRTCLCSTVHRVFSLIIRDFCFHLIEWHRLDSVKPSSSDICPSRQTTWEFKACCSLSRMPRSLSMWRNTGDRQWRWTHTAGSIRGHFHVQRNLQKENLQISESFHLFACNILWVFQLFSHFQHHFPG